MLATAWGVNAPVLCLTATAKPDVAAEIREHFSRRLGIELALFDGGAERTNLEFEVVPTTPAETLSHVHRVLEAALPREASGGAIVYCATRRATEETAGYLKAQEVAAEYFHAGLSPERKKDVQRRFIEEDSIPWNNNTAERALRHLAVQRKISNCFFKEFAPRHLLLLGIAQTCRFQGKSFLKFLLSGEIDVDHFRSDRRIKISKQVRHETKS